MSASNEKASQIHIHLAPGEREIFAEVARRHNDSVSGMVRRVVKLLHTYECRLDVDRIHVGRKEVDVFQEALVVRGSVVEPVTVTRLVGGLSPAELRRGIEPPGVRGDGWCECDERGARTCVCGLPKRPA